MASTFKKLKTLINQRFDALEADIKSIKMNQSNINRRLEAIEERSEK